MEFKEIQELIRLINKLELTEFKMRDGNFELNIRTKNFSKYKPQSESSLPQSVISIPQAAPQATYPVQQTTTPPPQPAAQPDLPAADSQTTPTGSKNNYIEIKSPMVGTFYRSSSPDKPPFIKVGDSVDEGSVVCIVEAMKLFNEIESEVKGTIVKVMVEDAQPVEYDQVLFLVDPKG
jgi:acetyl-CoA carboxylase biotin carboxyl carrier protein